MFGSMVSAAAQVAFNRYDIDIGTAKGQTVLTGFLLGGDFAELAVLRIDGNSDRHLRLYAFEGGNWTPKLDAKLRREALFVDVARIDGIDRLITYGDGRLKWFDPETAQERALVSVTSNFKPPREGEIPHVDITRDVNGNGRDDLVVPDSDGFRVFVQLEDGVFADPLKIGPPFEAKRIYGHFGYRYDPWSVSRIYDIDYNKNGRSDLAYWNKDHFEVHLQNEQGLFSRDVKTFTTDVKFDSDDPASLAAPHWIRHRRKDEMPPGRMTGRILQSLTDMNGDGVADLVVFTLDVKSMWKARSTCEVYYGTPKPDGGIAFAPDASAVIKSSGLPARMGSFDLDRDGQIDMMFTNIKIGYLRTIRMLIGALLTRSVSPYLEFYRMKGGVYPNKPSATRKIKTVSLGKSGEKAADFPAVLIGDVTGDGRPDLLVQKGRKELRIFPGVAGSGLFTKRPTKVKVAMPGEEEHTWLVDIKRDGKQDILMHHVSPNSPDRVTMLVAR